MLRALGLGLRILGSGFVGFRVRRLGLWLLHIIIESHRGFGVSGLSSLWSSWGRSCCECVWVRVKGLGGGLPLFCTCSGVRQQASVSLSKP